MGNWLIWEDYSRTVQKDISNWQPMGFHSVGNFMGCRSCIWMSLSRVQVYTILWTLWIDVIGKGLNRYQVEVLH